MRVILYSRPGCHLCDDLRRDLAEFQQTLGFTLVERNIEADAQELERFQYLIPVLEIADGPLLYPPHAWDAVGAALSQAAKQAQTV
jgi:glutaredoxin